MIYYQVAFPNFGCSLGAIEMKQGGHNGHSGQFSHSLCVLCGHNGGKAPLK